MTDNVFEKENAFVVYEVLVSMTFIPVEPLVSFLTLSGSVCF